MPLPMHRGCSPEAYRRARALVFLTLMTATACRDVANPERSLTPSPRRSAIDSAGPDSVTPRESRVIPGHYIVLFKAGVQDSPGLAKALVQMHGGNLRRSYTGALHGFAAEFPDSALDGLRHNPNVAEIESDVTVEAQEQESPVPSWGLDRIDQSKTRLDSKYNYVSQAGAGVNVYIIDTGIRTSHSDFAGRAFEAFTTVNDSLGATDCVGHGTHVAGTIGGTVYGVAKNARLFSVRVLDCSGSAPMSDLIAGLDWVAQNRQLPAVVNMSLSGEYSDAANQAVAGVVASGAVVVAAAGNDFGDACAHSPGSAPQGLTIGATNSADFQAGYSNFGPCVDLLAPGTLIKSDYFGTDTSTQILSGTSMAAPHVSGAAALYLSLNPTATPAEVTNAIIRNATSGVLTNLGAGSPNLLLYTGTLGSWTPVTSPTPAPTATFAVNCLKASCSFDASGSSDAVRIASYAWDFGDGTPPTSAASATTAHTYAAASTYTVVLTVTDTGGRAAKTSKLVRTKRP